MTSRFPWTSVFLIFFSNIVFVPVIFLGLLLFTNTKGQRLSNILLGFIFLKAFGPSSHGRRNFLLVKEVIYLSATEWGRYGGVAGRVYFGHYFILSRALSCIIRIFSLQGEKEKVCISCHPDFLPATGKYHTCHSLLATRLGIVEIFWNRTFLLHYSIGTAGILHSIPCLYHWVSSLIPGDTKKLCQRKNYSNKQETSVDLLYQTIIFFTVFLFWCSMSVSKTGLYFHLLAICKNF